MGLVARNPVFGVFDKVRYKPDCSATEISEKFEISLVESLDTILSNKGITKALIRLRGLRILVCALVVRKLPKSGILTSRPI